MRLDEPDFIVLDANLLDDIMHTRQIAAVYLRGVEVDRGTLRALDGVIPRLERTHPRRSGGRADPGERPRPSVFLRAVAVQLPRTRRDGPHRRPRAWSTATLVVYP